MKNLQEEIIHSLTEYLKHLKHPHVRKKAAKEKLIEIFLPFEFDLNAFCQKFCKFKAEEDSFLSYILSSIYYYEIVLGQLTKESIHPLFFVLLNESILRDGALFLNSLVDRLSLLTEKEWLETLCFCIMNPREGSWIVLENMTLQSNSESLFSNSSGLWTASKPRGWQIGAGSILKNMDPAPICHPRELSRQSRGRFNLKTGSESQSLIAKMRSGYYDPLLLQNLLTSISIQEAIVVLENKAQEEVKQILTLIPSLVDQIFASPNHEFNLLPNHEGRIQSAQQKLKALFAPFFPLTWHWESACSFFQLFGLRGFHLDLSFLPKKTPSLLNLLQELSMRFQNPHRIPFQEIRPSILFVLSICQQLHAYHYNPSLYAKGMDRIVYAMATRGENLSQQSWLPSLLSGLQFFQAYLKEKGVKKSSLKNHSIIIFDQSISSKFAKNRSYVRKLEKTFQIPICHLSHRQTVQLAKKLNVQKWIQTTSEDAFGYGGARNCLFFLAPIIHAINNKKKFNELIKLDKNKLHSLFNSTVLGKNGKDAILHIGEDDVFLPPSTPFSDALFAYYHQELYFQRPTYCRGRASHKVNPFLDLATVLKNPTIVFSSTCWVDQPSSGGMKALLTKPKFCLPLPFGNEECHVMISKYGRDFFQKPILHLAGTRFPKVLFPASPLNGIEEYLSSFLPYSLGISLSCCLIDSMNQLGHSILPWNDLEMREKAPFECLADLLDYAKSNQEELHRRLWHNLVDLFQTDQPKEKGLLIIECIRKLTSLQNIEAPEKLKKYYKKIQKDAFLFLDFGKTAVKYYLEGEKDPLLRAQKEVEARSKLRITETQLTQSLFLLMTRLTECSLFNDLLFFREKKAP